MRKLWILVVGILGFAHAQTGNHIHHLFGLKQETPGLFTQAALNQQNGGSVDIETFSLDFNLGGTYAYYTFNNRVLYFDSLVQTFSIGTEYVLPEIYTTNYTGIFGVNTFQTAVSSICVNPLNDSAFYAFDFNVKTLGAFAPAGNFIASSTQLPELLDINSLNQVYFQNGIYITSNNNANESVLYLLNASSLNVIDTVSYPFQSLYLVANQQLGIYAIAQSNAQQNYLVQINPTSLQLDTVALLPSCVNCATEQFNYDKNALVIDPENEQVILSREQSSTPVGQNFYLSTFDLNTGDLVYDIQTPERWSNLIFQKPMADLVYPGDTDHDKEVNMLDLLPIGLKYNDQVSGRFEISTEWIGQDAANTLDTLANGVDKKHADANGDGQINSVDVNAIFENYASIHYSEKSTQSNCDYPLFVQFPSLVKEDESIEIQIGLDLSANLNQEIYGLVFTIEYDESFVDSLGMETEGGSTWFGTEDGDYIQRFYQESPGRLAVGVVGIDQLNRNGGGGVLLNGIWTMEDVVIPIAQGFSEMDFRITDVTLIDFNQNYLDGCGIDTLIRVYDKNVGISERTFETLPLFPNPTKQNFVNLGNIDNLDYVEMYDVQGRMINTWNTNFEHLYLGEIPKGIYMLKAYTSEKMFVNKLLYDKE